MKRLTIGHPEDSDAFERSSQELADYYSRPRQPRREDPRSIFAPEPNERNGMLTSSEYELVELACTMSGKLAIANVLTRRGGLPQWPEAGPLPVLALATATPELDAPEIPEWEEANPDEIGHRAGLATILMVGIVTWVLIISLMVRA